MSVAFGNARVFQFSEIETTTTIPIYSTNFNYAAVLALLNSMKDSSVYATRASTIALSSTTASALTYAAISTASTRAVSAAMITAKMTLASTFFSASTTNSILSKSADYSVTSHSFDSAAISTPKMPTESISGGVNLTSCILVGFIFLVLICCFLIYQKVSRMWRARLAQTIHLPVIIPVTNQESNAPVIPKITSFPIPLSSTATRMPSWTSEESKTLVLPKIPSIPIPLCPSAPIRACWTPKESQAPVLPKTPCSPIPTCLSETRKSSIYRNQKSDADFHSFNTVYINLDGDISSSFARSNTVYF